MKTMKREHQIVRVKEDQVERYLEQGFEFCSKSEWKDLKKESEKNCG